MKPLLEKRRAPSLRLLWNFSTLHVHRFSRVGRHDRTCFWPFNINFLIFNFECEAWARVVYLFVKASWQHKLWLQLSNKGVLCTFSSVLLSLVAPALCLTPVLRVFCVSLLMSCYLLLLRHCVWPLCYGCFVYLFLCLVISCCSGIVFDPCFTGVLCISSYVLLSLVAPALCLTPVLRVFCVSLLMSCYLLLLRHCVWPLFYGCFVYLFLCLVISCFSGIVFDPCFTGVLRISSYVLLSLVAPALCLTPVLRVFCVSLLMSCYLLLLRHCVWPLFLRVFCVSLLMSCYLLLLRHCVWPLFYGCFVYLFLCLVISCCSGIVFDPCFTGVLYISSYVLLSLVAPALCLTPVLRVFCISLLMSCYLLLLRHCVWPLFYGCFVYLFLCLVISCCSGIVFDTCFTGVLCFVLCLVISCCSGIVFDSVLRVFCVSLLMSCYLLLLRHCVWPLFYGCFVYLFLCLVISCCSGIVFDPCFTGVLCISSYVLLSLVAPALCLTPVLRVFCVSLLMSCYLLLLRHCVWPLFFGCFVYFFLCLAASCCSSIVFDPCFTGVLRISSYVLLSLVAPALCLTPVFRVFCVSLLMSCYLLLLRHCVWPLFYGCFVYLFLCLVISCCSGIVFDPCFTGVLCISSDVLLSLVAPALCLTPVLRVFCVSLLMSCYLLLLRHCVWPLFYGCFVYLFLCLVISCCSGIVLDPCFTGVLRISSYVLLSLVAAALCLTPVLRVFCVSLLMSCYLLLLRHCVWPLFYGRFVYLFLCLVISCCSGIVFDPCFTGVLCISSYVLLSLVAAALCLTPVVRVCCVRVFCVSLLMSCYLLLLRHCVWPLFYGCFAYLFLCLVISCCSGIVFDPCFTGVLCISSYVLLSLVAPALCLTPVLRVFCVSLLMSCYLLLLRHCVWPLFYGCFVYLFLCLVISCCSGIVFDPCFTGVLCISSYVLLSLVAPALCLTPVLRVFCVSLLMSCYLLLLRHCVWPLFYGCFVYLFLCLVISCCSGIVFDPCFTGVLCISSYVLLSLVAPALCLTPVLRVFCVSLLMSCYLLLLRHCVWPLFYGCFVFLFLCFVISCCCGIVFDPCFTGVLCISSYVLLSLVAPALCLTPVLRVFCVSLLMSCYLLLLRHCVWPLFYGCFVYLFLCLVISCCSGIVFDPCFTGVLCISSYVLLSLVAPALCLTPVLRVFCVSLLMSCYLLLFRHCVWPLFYGCFVYVFLCLVISCCSGIVFDPCFTGVSCISSYVLLSLVAPALCLTPVLRVFCVSLLMSCYLLLLRHCVWPLFYGCFAYLFLCLVISCCSGIVFDPCFTGVLCISSFVLLSLVAPALCLTPVLRAFCVSLLMSCYLLLLRHCVWPLFYGCFVYLFLCLVISCCSGIVFDPCFTGVLCISSYVLLSLVAPALCLTPVLRVFCVSLLMSCYLLLLRHCVWPLFYGCFVYLFLCLVISCCSGIVFDPCFTGVLCISSYVLLSLVAPALCLTPVFMGVLRISSYVLLSLVAPALCLTPVLRVFCVSLLMSCCLLLLRHCVRPLFYGCFAYLFLCLVISCCSGIVFDSCFTGVLCISSYVLLSLVAPALCLTPVLRVFCASLLMSCYLLLLRHCVWPLFYGCFVYLFLCLVISCCSGIVFDPCFTGVLCISSYVLLSLVAPALCLTPVLRVFCVSLLMSCYLLLLRHCVWPLFYGCFVYLFLCLVISCCSGIVFDPCFTGVLCISSYVLKSLVAPALCLTPVLRVFCVSLLMSCYLLLLRRCVWPLFYGCFVYLFLCLVISCCSGIVFDPFFTGVLCISSYVLLSLAAPALCLTPVLRVFCVSLLCLVISCCSGIGYAKHQNTRKTGGQTQCHSNKR